MEGAGEDIADLDLLEVGLCGSYCLGKLQLKALLSLSPLRTAKNGKAEHVTTNKESWRWFTQCARVKEEEKESKGRECALQRLLPSPEILDRFLSAIGLILRTSSSFS